MTAHKEIRLMPGTKQGAARNPWIQHIKSSVYVSPHQANMSSECSDSSRLGSGTSAGRGGSYARRRHRQEADVAEL
jgi:hypothetical protein